MTTTRPFPQQDVCRRAVEASADEDRFCSRTTLSAASAGLTALHAGGPEMVVDELVLRLVRETGRPGAMAEHERRWAGLLRRLSTAKLRSWGIHELVDDAELLISELAANGLQHGQGPELVFRLVIARDLLLIALDDGCPRRPQIHEAGVDDERGRGLLIVSQVAADWGVSSDGTTTWCTLARGRA
ncbi:ATP-binding protein [Streptomyces sp. NBC_01476]|uniref:ATP-binding protein n=1 Tax=Streptomyces sp. NBC_01476 TaxID=2903881 RepID=UPI002E359125|nr:ATP-binding protein [Streptomyces sp. NBC_01476]